MFVYHMDPLQPYFVLNTGVYHKFIPVNSPVAHFYQFTYTEKNPVVSGVDAFYSECFSRQDPGSCRTGYLWAHQYYGDKAKPDALTFAKAMSDSLVPVGGVLSSEELYMAAYGNEETAFFHTATYQDNQISGITALACLEFMIEADVPGTIRKNAPYFWDGLYRLKDKYPQIIKDVRGRGYMIGIEYGQNKAGEYYTVEVCRHMSVESHVCTIFTINNDAVCRIYPNYWATKEDFDWALDALDKACAYVLSTMG